jgi:hypothetical protein
MPELKNTFQGGKMEKDIDERIVPSNQYREALNISVSTSEDSDVGAAQNILGNIKVTEAIQSRTWASPTVKGLTTSSSDIGGKEYAGENYHIAAIVDEKTNMLYRFVNTESNSQGIWMDRIVEYDTKASYETAWQSKESAVLVDIYKVRDIVDMSETPCDDGANKMDIKIQNNKNQVRWGMVISCSDIGLDFDHQVVVENVNYSTGVIRLNKNLDDPDLITLLGLTDRITNKTVLFHGDRNLNFSKDRSITGINIIDGMLFWTDNYSEPKKVNIKRSKMGSDSLNTSRDRLLIGRGIMKIDDFNQHTVLIVEEELKEDVIKDDAFCVIGGCTDPNAFNYDPNATIDDGSCLPPLSGCNCGGAQGTGYADFFGVYNDCFGDGLPALEFDVNVNIPCADGDGDTIPDCCTQTIPGCMDPLACCGSFNPLANVSDGSCQYIHGCTDPLAFNYDPTAQVDDGSCYFHGCMDPLAINHNSTVTADCAGVVGGSDTSCCTYLWSCVEPGYETDSCDEGDEYEDVYPTTSNTSPQVQVPTLSSLFWAFDPINYKTMNPLAVGNTSASPIYGAPYHTNLGHEELIVNYWANSQNNRQATDWTTQWFWYYDATITTSQACPQGHATNGDCTISANRINAFGGTIKFCLTKKYIDQITIGMPGIGFYREVPGTTNNNYGAVSAQTTSPNNPTDIYVNNSSIVFGAGMPSVTYNGNIYDMTPTWENIILYLRNVSIFDGSYKSFEIDASTGQLVSPLNQIQVPAVTMSMNYWEVRDIITREYNFTGGGVWNPNSQLNPGLFPNSGDLPFQYNGGVFNVSYANCACSGSYAEQFDCELDPNGIYATENACDTAPSNQNCRDHSMIVFGSQVYIPN